MSNGIDPEQKRKASRENLFVLLLGATLFAAGAAVLSDAIFRSITASSQVIARPR